jgi:hypothetical protein
MSPCRYFVQTNSAKTATDLALRDYTRRISRIAVRYLRFDFLAILLLPFFDGQTTPLDSSIGNFGFVRRVRYFTR